MNSISSEAIFAGNSEMAMLMRSLDWSQTLLGPISKWPQSLKITINILMNSNAPMFIWWGRESVNLYNDAACLMLNTSQHPHCLGRPAQDCWADGWDVFGSLVDQVFETGQPVCSEEISLMVERNGCTEEKYFTFSYGPMCDEKGGIGGIFCTVNETTQQVIGKRRLRTLRELSSNTVAAQTVEEACHLTIRTLETNNDDIPFALLYLVEPDTHQARLVSTTSNLEASAIAAPQWIDLTQSTDFWNLTRVHQTHTPERIDGLAAHFESSSGAWPEPTETAVVMPLVCVETQPTAGFLVVGVSPRRVLDDEYYGFIELVASHVRAAIAHAQVVNQENKHSDTMADRDRTKNAYLSSEMGQFYASSLITADSDNRISLRVLLANYLSDCQEEVESLLSTEYEVEIISNEIADLATICQQAPDIVLIGVKQAKAKGLELLQNLRMNPQTQALPVILLAPSCEAVARLEGLAAGADDFLTQPFIAREFLARVEATLKLAQLRRDAAQREHALRLKAENAEAEIQSLNQALTNYGNELQALFDLLPIGVAISEDPECRTIRANSYLLDLLRLPANANISQSAPPSERPAHRLLKQEQAVPLEELPLQSAALNKMQVRDEVVDIVHPDGTMLKLLCCASPLLDEQGNARGAIGGFVNITDRIRTETTLRESEAQFRNLADNAPVMVWVTDATATCTYLSQSWYEFTGQTEATGLGFGWLDALHPEDYNDVRAAFLVAHERREAFRLEYRLRHKEGEYRWVIDAANPWFGGDGQFKGYVGSVIDIRDRRRIEVELQQSQYLLQNIIDNATILVYVKDPEGRFILVNQQFERVFGQSKETFIGKTDYDFFVAEIADGFREKDRLVMTGETIEFEEVVPHVDGLLHDYISVKFPLYNPAGEIYALCGISTDITDRKQAEAALRESEARFRGVVESNMVGIFFWDASGCITDGNDMAVQMLGYSREELRSRQVRWQDITPPEFHEIDAMMQAQLLAEGNCAPFEKAYIRKDGAQVPILIGGALVPGYRDRGVAYFIDITERIQAEAALRESEDRLRLAIQSAALGTWDFNIITNELKWDEQCKAMFGLSPAAEVDYALFLACLHADDRDRVHEAVQVALCPNSKDEIDIQYRAIGIEDGVERWIAAKGKAFFNQAGEATRLIGTVLNITEQKRAEAEREQLLARERLYVNQLQGLTQAALAINSALSVEQVLQVINNQAASIIGTHQAVTSMTIGQNWEQAITSIYLSEKYIPWWDYDEKPDGTGIYACVCHLNRPIRLTQAELEAHPRWQNFGKAGEKHPPMRGWLAAPLMGRDGHNIGLIQLSDKYEGDFTEADEAILVQLAQMASVAVENAQLYEAEQQARAAAEIAREEAQSANRIKDEFLAVLSHELRSPLNPILGWSKLLLNKKLDQAKTDQALSTIARNAKLQAELIEDLLDVSRILRGKLSLNVGLIDLSLTIQAALETVRLSAEAKSIQIQTTLEANVGLIAGDSSRLQQVVWNLLSNAIKFTPTGGQVAVKLEQVERSCHLEASRSNGSAREYGSSRLDARQNGAQNAGLPPTSNGSTTASHRYAQITVSDTGKGIHPDFLPHVFDYFRQEDGATTRKFGGLGLGLAIVHHLVELHGGSVQAESLGEGQGATFTVRLPLTQDSTQPYPKPQAPEPALDLNGIQVLVVDDDTDTRDFVAFLLEQAGADVATAASADQALLTLAQFQPDVLLSDIGMPDMDGYMLLRQIRSRTPQQGSQIPAIALTAYAAEIDYQQAMAAGFQRHIPKPIEPQVLIQAIRILYHAANTAAPEASGSVDLRECNHE